MIAEHPYLQYFIGMHSFSDQAPFDASTMTYFRKRLTPEILDAINRIIIETTKPEDDHDDRSNTSAVLGEGLQVEPGNEGTLILDATCTPADIHFPTCVSIK